MRFLAIAAAALTLAGCTEANPAYEAEPDAGRLAAKADAGARVVNPASLLLASPLADAGSQPAADAGERPDEQPAQLPNVGHAGDPGACAEDAAECGQPCLAGSSCYGGAECMLGGLDEPACLPCIGPNAADCSACGGEGQPCCYGSWCHVAADGSALGCRGPAADGVNHCFAAGQ